MSRAIAAISGSAVPRGPQAIVGFARFFTAFWREITRDAVRPYRPELHYMRGPGPAWHAKYGSKLPG